MAIIISYPTIESGITVLLKNSEDILLDLADIAFQEQPEVQFNGRYFLGMV